MMAILRCVTSSIANFNEGIIAAGGNGYLIRAYSGISDRPARAAHRLPREKERWPAIAQHRHIIDSGAGRPRSGDHGNQLTRAQLSAPCLRPFRRTSLDRRE